MVKAVLLGGRNQLNKNIFSIFINFGGAVERRVKELVPSGHELLPVNLVHVDLRHTDGRSHHRVKLVHLLPRRRRHHRHQSPAGDIRREELDSLGPIARNFFWQS